MYYYDATDELYQCEELKDIQYRANFLKSNDWRKDNDKLKVYHTSERDPIGILEYNEVSRTLHLQLYINHTTIDECLQ